MKNQELSKRRQAIYIACYLGLYPGFIFWHFLSLKISGALRAELQATLSESALRNWDVFTFVLYAVALALLISRPLFSVFDLLRLLCLLGKHLFAEHCENGLNQIIETLAAEQSHCADLPVAICIKIVLYSPNRQRH